MISANLLHLSYNMWIDYPIEESRIEPKPNKDVYYQPVLRCCDQVWQTCLQAMSSHGMNMVILDLGDAVTYRSHPEIAVSGAWSTEKLKDELNRCRDLGLEPIPKLNFSSCHDAWLGIYSRMLSTEPYYRVCRDLIHETAELFGGPTYFHLGMDEETFNHQKFYKYCVVRQQDLWWNDLNFYLEETRKAGARPWVWSDVIWNCGKDVFRENMPMDVLQSNWYYGSVFSGNEIPTHVQAYQWLDELGYDQVPTGSNWSCEENMGKTVAFTREHLNPERILGYMMADWRPLTPEWEELHRKAIRILSESI